MRVVFGLTSFDLSKVSGFSCTSLILFSGILIVIHPKKIEADIGLEEVKSKVKLKIISEVLKI